MKADMNNSLEPFTTKALEGRFRLRQFTAAYNYFSGEHITPRTPRRMRPCLLRIPDSQFNPKQFMSTPGIHPWGI